MNEEVKNAIEATKKIIDNHFNKIILPGNQFNGYQQVYFNTNEKICSYLNIYDITNKEKAITVTAGGDHTLNLITSNILNIDTFDVNKLTEYFAFGLKFAMIRKYSFKEYLDVISKIMSDEVNKEELYYILFDLIPYMDIKYRVYWKEVIDYTYKMNKKYPREKSTLIDILFVGPTKIETIMFNNNYLLNEEFYNKLKANIGKANITFNIADASLLHEYFMGKKYDLVLLSNILGYFDRVFGKDWNYDSLKRYLNNIKTITNDDGIIYFYYLFIYERFIGYKNIVRNNLINTSSIVHSDLTEEELHKFNTEKDIINDAILLCRIKR